MIKAEVEINNGTGDKSIKCDLSLKGEPQDIIIESSAMLCKVAMIISEGIPEMAEDLINASAELAVILLNKNPPDTAATIDEGI